MKRLLRNQMMLLSKQQRYYEYHPASRSLQGSPDEVPPPVHFKIHKLPDSIPQSAHGFHATEFDPYLLDAVTTYDNWEYKYYGQWWDIGSVACNAFWLVFPVLLYLFVEHQNQQVMLTHDSPLKKYYTKGGFFLGEDVLIGCKARVL